jgi:hypothetical protein
MNPSGKSGSPDLGSVAEASKSGATDPSTVSCPLTNTKKHLVKVKLVYKDDGKPVQAAACKILKGTTEVDSGPLAAGQLGTAKTLDAGAYEVTFPEIDSAEWDVG